MSGTTRHIAFLICLWLTAASRAFAADPTVDAASSSFRLVRAVMCETITGVEPKFIAAAFSINAGKISCYSSFDGITETTFVDHRWYRRDELVTSKRLTIKPPNWSTYSSIQLREADKGPWRVEIRDAQDKIIKIVRFSVVD